MLELWINVLGFSSGNTGWVVTEGDARPYVDDRTPSTADNGVLCRHDRDGFETLRSLADRVDEVAVLSYGGDTSAVVAKDVFLAAARNDVEFEDDEPGISQFMPD